jgi:hypothetical protein
MNLYRLNVSWFGKEHLGQFMTLEEYSRLRDESGNTAPISPDVPDAPAYFNDGSGVEILTSADVLWKEAHPSFHNNSSC